MFRRKSALALLLILMCGSVASARTASAQGVPSALLDKNRIVAEIKPTGKRYRATVPDTLDLAERARLAVHGLTAFLDEKANYAPYGHTYWNGNPPYMADLPGGPPNWGKIAESLIFARLMCGSEENLDIEAQSLRGMLLPPVLLADKTYAFSPDYERINPAAPTPLTRAMLALMALYQTAPNPALKACIDKMAADHMRAASHEGDLLYYADPPPMTNDTFAGVYGTYLQVFMNGCAVRALARWSELGGDRANLDAAGKLAKFALQDKFWMPEADAKAIVAPDRGHFSGHIHSYTQFLMGLLCYAEDTHDAALKEFVRSGYEYIRNFGIARIGLFGEACATGDMTYLALKLSDTGAGDYWDDADRYVRNHLAELQITDAAKLRRAVQSMPQGRGKWDPQKGPIDARNETADRVIERNIGIFLSDSTHPTQIPDHSFMATICCTGNCTPALYFAWDSIVRCKNGNAQVNLLLNRASPWLDVDSYLPYEGKVVIHNKTARRLSVRMPRWVDATAVRCRVNGQTVDSYWTGRYIVFDALPAGANVTITFPVAATTETYRLAWKQSEFWQESLNPGHSWQPATEPTKYVCRFRGNTLVDISPRAGGIGYPLYQRDEMKQTKAPMRSVIRYIPPNMPKW